MKEARIIASAAMLILAMSVLLSSMLYAVAKLTKSGSDLIVGSWEPAVPVWPRATLTLDVDYPLPTITTADGWELTPNHYYLNRAIDAQNRKERQ